MLINADKNFFDKTQEMALDCLLQASFGFLQPLYEKKDYPEVEASGKRALFIANAPPDGADAIDLRVQPHAALRRLPSHRLCGPERRHRAATRLRAWL